MRAEDELALLVNGFNQMTEALESSGLELDRAAFHGGHPRKHSHRRNFDRLRRLHPAREPRALQDFSRPTSARATRLEDLFSREDTAEIKYLMKRARRTGWPRVNWSCAPTSRKIHLAVTVSALEAKLTSGFVVVLEDTSELLRAQKAAAWHEVARRVAHEIKNPLTPIALSAERIGRQLDRWTCRPAPRASCTNAPKRSRNRWNR